MDIKYDQNDWVNKYIDVIKDEWILEYLVNYLRESIKDYALGIDVDYDAVRSLYSMLFATHYELLRLVNPRWTIGKERLVEWYEDVSNFNVFFMDEPYLAEITPQSASIVRDIMPKCLRERLGDKRIHAFAAIRNFEDQIHAAGCLMYHTEGDKNKDVFIDFLYVPEKYRRLDIANSLIARMFLELASTDIGAIYLDYEHVSLDIEPVLELVKKWHFDFLPIPDSYLKLSIEEITNSFAAKTNVNMPDTIRSLNELNEIDISEYIDEAVKNPEGNYDEILTQLPVNSYELSTSCFAQKDGKITGMLLLTKDIFGRLELTMLRADNEDVKTNLLIYALKSAGNEYNKATAVRIPARNDEELKYISNILGDVETDMIVRCILPEPEKDIDYETWKELSKSDYTDKEKEEILNALMEVLYA